jgi:hypothetical protein
VQPPVTPQDVALTNLSGKDLQYLGLLVASFAALATIVVAFINAIANRLQALAVARRDYLIKALQPVIDFTEQDVAYLRRLGARNFPDDREQQVPFPGLGGLGLVTRSRGLKKAWAEFKRIQGECYRNLGTVDRERAARRDSTDAIEVFDDSVDRLQKSAIAFRQAVERRVFWGW